MNRYLVKYINKRGDEKRCEVNARGVADAMTRAAGMVNCASDRSLWLHQIISVSLI